jgi:polar amino acid transport system ATP-binding protein
MTMILTTHEMGFCREIADTVCFLDGGVLLERGTPEQIFSDPHQPRTRKFLQSVIDARRL